METRLDMLSKVFGSDLSRRQSFRIAGASVLATVLSAVGVREVEARDPCRDQTCVACHAEDQCGVGNAGCSCIPKMRRGSPRRCFCHNIVFCTGLIPCNTNRDCRDRLGRGWKCGASCCGNGAALCHPKCNNEQPPIAVGGGLTSAG